MPPKTPPRRSRARRQSQLEPSPHANLIGCGVLVLSVLFLVILWMTQEVLESVEIKTHDLRLMSQKILKHLKVQLPESLTRRRHPTFPSNGKASKYAPPSDLSHPPDKYIVFDHVLEGQGMGNVISGLLSAHLLGLEFNRIVCTDYPSFFLAFEPVHPWILQKCPTVLQDGQYRRMGHLKRIRMITYENAPNECSLQSTLRSNVTIVHMRGNTYPRWPLIPDELFFAYYQPKPALLQILPYDWHHPPKIVVHLREPDGFTDVRRGVDPDSLKALGELLKSNGNDTYLVTNRVEWYDYFERNYNWRHPEWNTVVHSAGEHSWGVRQQRDGGGGLSDGGLSTPPPINRTMQDLQMWADWYTLLTAELVYHTHSDFSVSAIHWRNLDSRSIQGMGDDGKLLLVNESWRVDGETEPLVDRTPTGKGTAMLRLCGYNGQE